VIVIVLPTGAVAAEIELISAPTEKFIALLDTPETLTITGPLVAVVGIVTTMLVSLQLIGFTPFPATAIPFNVAVLKPSAAPNPDPSMVKLAPSGPVLDAKPFTRKPVMVGCAAATPETRANVTKIPHIGLATALEHFVIREFCTRSAFIGPFSCPARRPDRSARAAAFQGQNQG
jgi:hypothetical protein